MLDSRFLCSPCSLRVNFFFFPLCWLLYMQLSAHCQKIPSRKTKINTLLMMSVGFSGCGCWRQREEWARKCARQPAKPAEPK